MKPAISKLSDQKANYPQWITGIGATVIFIEVGIMCGWSSPYVARLTAEDSPLPLTAEQASWVASLMNLGRFFGAICGTLALSFFGSKKSLTLTVLPITLSWIFIMVANSYLWLYIARTLGGMGMGMAYSCLALFVGEVALPKIRGAILSIAVAGGSAIGMVIASIVGPYLSMLVSGGIFLIPCVLVFLLFLWIPDSPHWLVKKEDYERAKRSIAWYQPEIDSEKELEVIRNLVHGSSTTTFFGALKKFESKPIRKAFLLIIVLFTSMQVTGLNSIMFYMETILIRSKVTVIEPSTVVILVNGAAILATCVSMVLIEKSGRKILFVMSSIGVGIAMAGLGANSYMITLNMDMASWQWLPITAIFTFMITYFIGMLGVPSAVLSEIFPSDMKFIAGFVASSVGGLWSFAVTKSYQPLIDTIGEPYVFWLHGVLAVIFVPYILLCMPETKGKTLQEIQDKLIKR